MADPIPPPPWTLENLIETVRLALDDLPGDVVDEADSDWKSDDDGLLWSNGELVQWAQEAQDELGVRRPIKDALTPEVCQIAFAANDQTKSYHVSIEKIEDAFYVETASGTHYPLTKYSHFDFARDFAQWRTFEAGKPSVYVEDLSERSITLSRKPDLAGTLHLVVQRRPIRRLLWSQRHIALEHSRELQPRLVPWILYKAYEKDDVETKDAQQAEKYKAQFDAGVGVQVSAARSQLLRNERNTHRRTRASFL